MLQNAVMSVCDLSETPALHPALAGRFSPLRFDPVAEVSTAQVDVLLEAARRAPSAGNSQPWRFIVGRRGDDVHTRLVRHLGRSSSVWAPAASLLVANLAHVSVEDAPDWEYSEFSHYDLGQAVAHMTVQGLAMGLAAHQFRAFDRDAVAAEFSVPGHYEVTSMTAIGHPAHRPGELTGAGTSRDRAAPEDIVWARA